MERAIKRAGHSVLGGWEGEELLGEEPGEAGFRADQGSDSGGAGDTAHRNYSCPAQNYRPSDTSEAWKGNVGLLGKEQIYLPICAVCVDEGI